jgi:DNA-binding transcriptional LysR family regulator
LIGDSWVLAQPGSLARSLHDDVFRASGLEPPSAAALTLSLHLYMRLIETGRWLGIVPGSVMRFGGKQMRLKALPVRVPSPPAPVGFMTVKNRILTSLAERFAEYARKAAASILLKRRHSGPNLRILQR